MAEEKKPFEGFDPANFDPSKFDPSKFDPSKIDFSKIDFSKMKFDPSKMPPMPPMEDDGDEEETTEENNILCQPDPQKWLRQPPKKIRGNMKKAFKWAGEAEKYKCTCWNKRCPFYGNCRKCIVFHMALKQLPTCQREMVIELIQEGVLSDELYINN